MAPLMSDPRTRLRDKLCRELAQSERDARLHTRREAKRLGECPPAQALLAIAAHADDVEVALEKLTKQRVGVGLRVARAVAKVISGDRNIVSCACCCSGRWNREGGKSVR